MQFTALGGPKLTVKDENGKDLVFVFPIEALLALLDDIISTLTDSSL